MNSELVFSTRKEKFDCVSGRGFPAIVGPNEDRQVLSKIDACVLNLRKFLKARECKCIGGSPFMHI